MPRKRSNGEGSLHKRSNGLWEWQVMVRLLSPHCCRHTYVSQLQAQGVPLETIQSLTGHADVDMTEHYLHVQKEVKEDAAQKLDSLFKKGKPALHIA